MTRAKSNRLHRAAKGHHNGRARGRKKRRTRPAARAPATREARRAEGRALRGQCPRPSHSAAALSRGRDPLGLIERSNEGRAPELLPVRFTRMLESPFAFFRGTAVVQAHDLEGTPSAGIVVQSCGDCHLMNFGGFASPERTLLFDITDFDETSPAPFEWDVKRLAASFAVASRWREFGRGVARDAAKAAVRSYREHVAGFARMSALEVWYARVTFDDVVERLGDDPIVRRRIDELRREAARRTPRAQFDKMTRPVRGRPRVVDQPPLLYHPAPSVPVPWEQVATFFDDYRATLPADRRVLFDRYQLADAVFKVVGVGSVGTLCFVTLWMADDDDPLFLQVKQARPSVLEGLAGPSRFENEGERVVVGQRLMQSASDIFLGWTRGPGDADFYVRQLRDHKVDADLATQTPRVLLAYADLCGQTLARAHAKSGKAAHISGYLGSTGKFDAAVADYAVAYADQVEKDYEAFRAAVRAGRFPTETNVLLQG